MMWTEDLSATVEFYVEKLGFTCRELNEKWGWASLNLDEAWIMLTRPNEHTTYEKIGFTGSFYFNTDDVDRLWEELKDKARICYGIELDPRYVDVAIRRWQNLTGKDAVLASSGKKFNEVERENDR